uniref:Secreted protein n=1 Tax=Anopheles quadriannulatus TaxID=34691 RepID=A0A182XRQ9_ANOQN
MFALLPLLPLLLDQLLHRRTVHGELTPMLLLVLPAHLQQLGLNFRQLAADASPLLFLLQQLAAPVVVARRVVRFVLERLHPVPHLLPLQHHLEDLFIFAIKLLQTVQLELVQLQHVLVVVLPVERGEPGTLVLRLHAPVPPFDDFEPGALHERFHVFPPQRFAPVVLGEQ